MATRTKIREPLPRVTEESLLNEAMECPADRSLETNPLAEERPQRNIRAVSSHLHGTFAGAHDRGDIDPFER